MRFLDASQQRAAYRADLEYEGYARLGVPVYRLWHRLVARGFGALSPGFLAAVVERLQARESAVRLPGRSGSTERIRFLYLPVWTRILTSQRGGGSLTENPRGFRDQVAYLLEFFDLGRSDRFHWGLVPESEADLLEGDLDNAETKQLQSLLGTYREEQRGMLRERTRRAWDFGMSQELQIQHPELLSSVFLEEVHRQWDHSYTTAMQALGAIQPLTDTSDQLEHFADPHLQMTGGYCDLEVRGEGSWSALLASELAYQDESAAIDYFDVKYLESQLLYFKKEEGIDRVVRRRIRFIVDARRFTSNVRVLARFLAWLELSIYLVTHLFEKDRLQIIVHIDTGREELTQPLNQLLLLRTRRQNPGSDGELRFSEPDIYDGLRWQEISIGPDDVEQPLSGGFGHRAMVLADPVKTLGLSLKTHRLYESRLLVHMKELKQFLEGNTHAKVSA